MAELRLRDYQQTIVDKARMCHAGFHQRVIVALPTGGGKTEIAVALAQAEAEAGGHTLFVVERKTLARQGRNRFLRYGINPGILRGEDTVVRHYSPVTVASVQTLAARREHEDVMATIERTTLVIVDEAHIRYKYHEVLLELLPHARVVGLSATPLRDGLATSYQHLIRGPSYDDMIGAGHLVRPRYYLPSSDDLARALHGVGVASTGDFVSGDLSELMRKKTLVGDVISTWQAKAHDRPTIAFCVDKAHSRALTDEFQAVGIAAEHIEDRTPEEERTAIFRRFREGETRVLCSIGVLSVGFDEPCASAAILARPTLSLSLHVQQIGRVLRPHPGKADAVVLDHAGNVARHGRIEDFRPPDLDDIDKHSDRKPRSEHVADYRPCPECRAIMAPRQRVCSECGHELVRKTMVDHVAGELREEHEQRDDGPSREELRDLYLELRWIAQERGWKDGWAFMKLKEHYGLKAPWSWKDMATKAPTDRTQRLVKSWAIAWRKAQAKQEGGDAFRGVKRASRDHASA